MKRFFSVLLVVVLLFSLAVPAFAVDFGGGETVVPVASAPAVGAVDEPIDELVEGDFTAVAPAMGELAAVATDSAFPPVYSPESYLIQSLFECNIELLRSTFKKYKYCQFVYDNNTRKFMRFFLFNELPAVPFKTSNNNEFTSALCVVDLTGANSRPFIDVYNKEPIFHPCEDGQDISFSANSAFKVPTSYNSYLFNSFNYSWVHTTDSGLKQNEFVTPVGVNAILKMAKTGVVVAPPTSPPENPYPDLGGGDKTNGFIGEYGARILLPRNDFKQSKLNTIATKIYYKVPYNGVMGDVKLKVSGYIGDNQAVTYHKVQELSDNTVLEGYLDVAGAVTWNETKPITFTITDYNGKAYTCAVDVTCYDDFIDTDNDGLDDRTNQDEWTGNPDFNKPLPPDNSPPEGSNIIEWFKWFFNSIGEFFATLKSGFDSVISYGGDFSKFLGSAFSYLPSEISVLIGLGFTALVFLRIFGR